MKAGGAGRVLEADGEEMPEGAMEALICMKDNEEIGTEIDTEIGAENARCRHPSTQCRFREWCPVAETIRASRSAEARRARDPNGRT